MPFISLSLLPTCSEDAVHMAGRTSVEASYYDGVVTFVVNRDLGVADIVVVNMTSGDQWSDTILGVGTTSIILDGESGEYYIYIYTDYGEYSGTFII